MRRLAGLMIAAFLIGGCGTGPSGPASQSPMVVAGRAGYVAGVLGADSPQQFRSVYVGAWAGTYRARFCVQTLGSADGSFSLEIPVGCFAEGETVYLTAGGLDTCTTTPFRSGSRIEVELLGRRTACM